MFDLALNENYDFILEGGDLKVSRELKESIIIALTTAKGWWADKYSLQQEGGDFYHFLKQAKYQESDLSLIKTKIISSLAFLKKKVTVKNISPRGDKFFLEMSIEDQEVGLTL